jgi:hypothetical protein
MIVHSIVYRVSPEELAGYEREPGRLVGLPLEDALREGRAVDLGRAWEELGCLLEGGIRTPETGPTVGEEHLLTTADGVAWNLIRTERVAEIARDHLSLSRDAFYQLFHADDADTADSLPGDRTGEWGDHSKYLYDKFRRLKAFYEAAAGAGEAVLVRLGPQRRGRRRS